MTKSELGAAIAEKAGTTQATAGECVDALAEIVSSEVRRGGEVNIPSFIKFSRKDTKARTGRNPQTGATIQVPAGTAVKIQAGSKLKAAGKGA